MKLPTDKTFHYKIAFLHCLQAYLKNDIAAFNKHRNNFYADSKSRAYNDYDLTVRYLEIILLLRLGESPLADHKLLAAIKFVRRNFTASRIKLEREHWRMFNAAIHGKPGESKQQPVFRLTAFISAELSDL